MGTLANDFPFIEDNNQVRISHCGNPLGNNDRNCLLNLGIIPQGQPEFGIGLEVQCGEGIIKDVDGCRLDDCPSDCASRCR